MQSPDSTQWNTVDLPLLREIVKSYDEGGAFAPVQSSFRVAREWSPKDFAFAAKRLADTGYIDVRYRAGGFVDSVDGVTEKARRAVSGPPGPPDEAPAPRLDALDEQLRALLGRAAAALEAEPDHPKAARWKAFLRAGLDVGTDPAPGSAAASRPFKA